MTDRPTYAEMDLGALENNLGVVRGRAPGCKVLAVVKADAYGHGAVEVSWRLVKAGVEMLGVALVREAAELRGAGVTVPIVLLGGIFPEQAADVVGLGLTPVVYTSAIARALSEEAVGQDKSVPVHVKVDTGMGRLGLPPGEVHALIEETASLPGLEPEGLMTHLSDVEGDGGAFAEHQVGLFRGLIESLGDKGIRLPLLHAAGSAAVASYTPALFNLVRPGLMLYGCNPLDAPGGGEGLRAVMSVRTRVMYVKRVGGGVPIGYDRAYHTKTPSVIATLPIGYADGFMRSLSNSGEVLIRGRRCPVVGNVCMDLVMVDVTGAGDVAVGDEAVIVGRQGEEEISADDVAGAAGTISYEILCGFRARMPRVYRG